jgi:hypothetical protein
MIQAVFIRGINEGLERGAQHCEYIAKLASSVRETDCSTEVLYARWRAEELRNLKITNGVLGPVLTEKITH